MTLASLKAALAATGYPVAYSHFKTRQTPPFICIRATGGADFRADDATYLRRRAVDVELYTDKKDEAAEAAVEAVIGPSDCTESWIDEEKLYLTAYSIVI